MAEQLAIYRNGTLAHEFDKRAALERMQFAYVQRMDADMDRGIRLNGERILSPSQKQRNQFVIGQLLEALSINDSPSIVQHRLVMPLPRAACTGSRHHSHRRRWREEYNVDLVYA